MRHRLLRILAVFGRALCDAEHHVQRRAKTGMLHFARVARGLKGIDKCLPEHFPQPLGALFGTLQIAYDTAIG